MVTESKEKLSSSERNALRPRLREEVSRFSFTQSYPLFRDAVNAGAKAAMEKLFNALDAKAKWSESCEGLCITATDWKEFKSKIKSEAAINGNGAAPIEASGDHSLGMMLRSEVTRLALDKESPLREAMATGASTALDLVLKRIEAASTDFEGVALSGPEYEKLKGETLSETLVF